MPYVPTAFTMFMALSFAFCFCVLVSVLARAPLGRRINRVAQWIEETGSVDLQTFFRQPQARWRCLLVCLLMATVYEVFFGPTGTMLSLALLWLLFGWLAPFSLSVSWSSLLLHWRQRCPKR